LNFPEEVDPHFDNASRHIVWNLYGEDFESFGYAR